jgi:D-alanine transaminase
LAKNAGCRFVERAFTIQEAYDAAEAFITSATSFVTPVTKIDQNSIGNGEVGPVTSQLRDLYLSSSGL